jgi:hypothetical protein
MDNSDKNELKLVEAVGNPELMVPKFATSVNFAKTKNRGVVMTVFSNTPLNDKPILLNTFYIEEEHAHEIVDVLKKLIN